MRGAAATRRSSRCMVEDSADDAELVLLELSRGGFAVRALRVETAGAMAAALAGRPGTWCCRTTRCRASAAWPP